MHEENMFLRDDNLTVFTYANYISHDVLIRLGQDQKIPKYYKDILIDAKNFYIGRVIKRKSNALRKSIEYVENIKHIDGLLILFKKLPSDCFGDVPSELDIRFKD